MVTPYSEFGVHCKPISAMIHSAMIKNASPIQHQLTIPDEYANLRLDQALAKLLPDYSRTQIKEWIDTGLVQINGQAVKGKSKITGGEEVSINATLKLQPQWEAEELPLPILYEDEAIIVINKPAGLVVHPGAGNARSTLLNALLHHAPDLQTLPRAGILHRIDKDTTGLLVVAKTAQALKHLSRQLKHHELQRDYQAVVYGDMISGGRVDAPVGRHPLQRKRMAVVDTGKEATTHYRIAAKYRGFTRLALQLETGRTHQIRVHLSYIHHPIVGDLTYGGRVRLTKGMSPTLIELIRGFKRQALHAFALSFTHPITEKSVRFEAPIPDDMQTLIHALEDDASK
jgi:23S rRNA pseudouridine1911/1915/1917 synthase